MQGDSGLVGSAVARLAAATGQDITGTVDARPGGAIRGVAYQVKADLTAGTTVDRLVRESGAAVIVNAVAMAAPEYVMENGCKWRRLPERFGNWQMIYTRMNRWSKNGVWDRIFAKLPQ